MIEFDYVITNGYVDIDTLQKRVKGGWKFVCTIPASIIHPHALETDKVTIFTRYRKTESKEETTTVNAFNDAEDILNKQI